MTGPAIEIAHLSHAFQEGGAERRVLSDVSAEIGAGEIIILTGPSGSGKTTLLTLIGALRSTHTGSVRVLGEELQGASEGTLARVRTRIGYVFQAHNLLPALTACQNVELSLELFPALAREERGRRARGSLDAVGLGERLDAFPSELSGGQRQRVAIARALARRPEILLADEPTASLDRDTGRAIVELIEQLARGDGVTVVIVTHDHRILDVADRILTLEDGRLTSLVSAVATNTERMLQSLSRDLRKGTFARHVAAMDEQAFRALLEDVTAETTRLLEVVDTLQGETFVSLLGQVLDAFREQLMRAFEADDVRVLFLDESSGDLWSLAPCEHGGHREISEEADQGGPFGLPGLPGGLAAAPGALPSSSPHLSVSVLRAPIEDSRHRAFATVEVARTDPVVPFGAQDESRLRDIASRLGAILETWWRMSCSCRTGPIGRLPPCCAATPARGGEDGG